jgi:hypothetical protein
MPARRPCDAGESYESNPFSSGLTASKGFDRRLSPSEGKVSLPVTRMLRTTNIMRKHLAPLVKWCNTCFYS